MDQSVERQSTLSTLSALSTLVILIFYLSMWIQEMTLSKVRDGASKPTLSSHEFLDLFKEMTTRPEIYFLLVR